MAKKDTYHHKNLKEELIEAGITLVAKEGLEGFSLRKVAAVCGVSHAAPYSHFENKDVLLEEMQNYKQSKLMNRNSHSKTLFLVIN